jgi:hypothetical protein
MNAQQKGHEVSFAYRLSVIRVGKNYFEAAAQEAYKQPET